MKKSTIIQIVIIIALAIILGLMCKFLIFNNNSNEQMQNGGPQEMSQTSSNVTSTNAKGATTVTDEQNLEGIYESSTSDESPIKVSEGGIATIENATINKSAGDSSNTENSDFYGVNSGVLTTENSTTTIKNSKITTNAKGANAIFATGENAKVYVYDTEITTNGSSSSRGLDATYGGYIEADNVKIITQGGSCATLATDRGEGTVIAKNSTLETNGAGSPIIYSTGDISIENTTGTANGAQMTVIEGKNTATVTNSTLKCSGKGNRNDVDNCGIMIYQSMSGDAGEGTGTFNSSNSTLEIASDSDYYKTAPFFFITNTDAVINLENNTIKYGSGTLISAKGTGEWGKSGSNGGNVTLNTTNQKLTGDIIADSLSTVTINLSDKSSLEGTINGDNTAKSVVLKLDSSSTLTLTGDTYVTSLEDSDSSYSNIIFNGHKLYVNGTAVN